MISAQNIIKLYKKKNLRNKMKAEAVQMRHYVLCVGFYIPIRDHSVPGSGDSQYILMSLARSNSITPIKLTWESRNESTEFKLKLKAF